MRHGNKINHLGRTFSHRKAMLSNMATALFMNKRIETTLQKAKELRVFVEPLITKAKNNSTHSRRLVFSKLQDKYSTKELFDVIAEKIADRPGGYTRIIQLDNRLGDNADMCMIELVDFNTVYGNQNKTTEVKKKSRRGSSKKKDTDAVVEKTEAVVEETNEVIEKTEE